jgi:hypothetical protein
MDIKKAVELVRSSRITWRWISGVQKQIQRHSQLIDFFFLKAAYFKKSQWTQLIATNRQL